MLELKNPANGEIFATLNTDKINSLDDQFAKAVKSQNMWNNTPLNEKKEIIHNFNTLLLKEQDDCALVLTKEMGKPINQAKSEIKATTSRIEWFLQNIDKNMEPSIKKDNCEITEHITWEPQGIVLNISAWNFPYFIGSNVFIPALLTGNAVLYKPSEICSLTGLRILELLIRAGLPKDVFQVFIGRGDLGQALLDLPVDSVFFTGSYDTGKRIWEQKRSDIIPITLELGGKDPAYLCDDIHIENVSKTVLDGVFYNAGQSCCAIERLYVHENIYDHFVECFIEDVKKITVGDPMLSNTYLGPLARYEQLEFLNLQMIDAKNKGASIALHHDYNLDNKGAFFHPAILLNTNHKMNLMKDESFGPIIGIQKVKSDEEACELMNDTKFGLTSSVFTKNKDKAIKILERLDSGTVYWNCCDRVSPFLPWSGRKHSGIGSTLSDIGIKAFLKPKSWHLKS